jgi:hypothetical protein
MISFLHSKKERTLERRILWLISLRFANTAMTE